jgi:aryl-alcohol dehydrogenase-like predicted oxidoreductase
MQTRRLGNHGPADERESIATIHAAIDAGVSLLDTGDFYGMGHNELLIRQGLRDRRRESALIRVKFRALRDASGATVSHVAIAWVLSRDPAIVPLVGARRRERLAESLGAMEFELSTADLEAIERAIPPGSAAGDRYMEAAMHGLDSERERA